MVAAGHGVERERAERRVGAPRPGCRRLPPWKLPRAVQLARVAQLQSAVPRRAAEPLVQGPLQGTRLLPVLVLFHKCLMATGCVGVKLYCSPRRL